MAGFFINDEENKTPGPAESGERATEPNIVNPGGTRKITRTKTTSLPAVRATTLMGQEITRHQSPKSTYRRQTQLDIYGKDPEIPYVKFEAAFRDMICSLMERQDRMNEEIFLKLNDLGYQIEDLQQERTSDGGGR